MTDNPIHDPARVSHYVSDAYYAALVAAFSDWQHDDKRITDATERDLYRQFLDLEARLLDQHRYGDWLDMFVPECAYWVPATPEGGDPRGEIAITFDDRRRLEDRIFRLGTGYAWSQAPRSRTVRAISNVEVFSGLEDGVRMVRSNFLISEFWGGETCVLAGWAGHRIVAPAGEMKIAAKQVNLIDCDQCLRNPSIIF